MSRFAGRVAVVVGAGHGIGAATARRLSREGAAVALLDLDVDAAAAVSDSLGGPAGDHAAFAVDLTDKAAVQGAIAATVSRFGGLDVLVNAAGGAGFIVDSIATSEDADWERLIQLNLIGVLRTVRAALPHLLASSFGGAVVTVSSVNGLAAVGQESYSAAKAGLTALTQNLAARYGPQGLRANVVAPGTIRTRVWDHQAGGPDRLKLLYPLGRVGEPDDVAAAIAFLASDDASWITGVTLPVDGGLLAGPAHLNTTITRLLRDPGGG